jgi:5-methylcytosine-specific restriction endonuclease McrA
MNRTATPNPRYRNGHRRRRVRAQVLAEETCCALCGLPVDVTLPPWLPGSPEVDEIIQVSRGGSPFDRANCRLVHRLCNVRAGNGIRRRPTRVVPFMTTRRW